MKSFLDDEPYYESSAPSFNVDALTFMEENWAEHKGMVVFGLG